MPSVALPRTPVGEFTTTSVPEEPLFCEDQFDMTVIQKVQRAKPYFFSILSRKYWLQSWL
jgi:hypothetical protein